jgi:hypothetical protein
MYTIADLKEYLDKYDDSLPIVIRADTKCELYDDAGLLDLEERLTFEPVSLMLTEDADCWGHDDGGSNRIRIKALSWKEN